MHRVTGSLIPDWLHNQCSVSQLSIHMVNLSSYSWNCERILPKEQNFIENFRGALLLTETRWVDMSFCASWDRFSVFLGWSWNRLTASEKWSVWNWAGSTSVVFGHKPTRAVPPAPIALGVLAQQECRVKWWTGHSAEHWSVLKINLRKGSFFNWLPSTDPMQLTEGAAWGGNVWLEEVDGLKTESGLQRRRVSVESQFVYPLMIINA